jgi:hypothetical protein
MPGFFGLIINKKGTHFLYSALVIHKSLELLFITLVGSGSYSRILNS